MATDSGTKFNVAVIGYGLSAKVFHIPFFNHIPQFNLHTIIQRNPDKGPDSAPRDYPTVKHHTSPEPMLSDPDVDLVAILTPPDTHLGLATRCLEAGKHVLVEKPFVPSVADADRLIALARRVGRLICVYQNRRWDADFLALRSLLAEGRLGRAVELDTHFDRFRPQKPAAASWKGSLPMERGGGILYDLGSHLVDQAYCLFGLPRAVYGRLVGQREGKLFGGEPDGVHAVLSYADGTVVTVRAGFMSVEDPQPRFWLRGTKGSLRISGLDPQEDQLRRGMKPSDPGFGIDEAWKPRLLQAGDDGTTIREVPFETSKPPATYIEFFEQLARALQSGREENIPVKATEAREVLRILEAVRESARTGREVRLQ
ncbi:oxidoreductase family protein [Sodiomyces alkalinus F11]|uniref:Oxidoreductase family protein n=1 Tax=Sodiomyces alkalinus (strain CBS 110278 / VKM F-3762 / F11) TaxID=1314773 RepID=A0A3N2PZQ3_SODAK|nr:oxidoreductase family protein [Sodiomyces alkalinus F11]ROT39906.1 oxidoreductase family protein [Sodiomyces alkalinus F11]